MGHSAPPRFPYPIYRGGSNEEPMSCTGHRLEKNKAINNTHIYNHDEQ